MLTYLELKALPDHELSARGFTRNDRGGISRIPGTKADTSGEAPKAGGKTWGLVSFAKAMLSGDADPAVRYARLTMCYSCGAKDSTGQRLYRVLDGKAYCGVPRLSDVTKILRDEAKDGCGCELLAKIAKKESDCPLRRWPTRTSIPTGLQFDTPELARQRAENPPPPPPESEGLELPQKPCNCGGKIADMKRHLQNSEALVRKSAGAENEPKIESQPVEHQTD